MPERYDDLEKNFPRWRFPFEQYRMPASRTIRFSLTSAAAEVVSDLFDFKLNTLYIYSYCPSPRLVLLVLAARSGESWGITRPTRTRSGQRVNFEFVGRVTSPKILPLATAIRCYAYKFRKWQRAAGRRCRVVRGADTAVEILWQKPVKTDAGGGWLVIFPVSRAGKLRCHRWK